MKALILLGAVAMFGACTHATSMNPSSPMTLTGVWGVSEPVSPLGDGTAHATEQATRAVSTGPTTTNATVTSSGTKNGASSADVGDNDSARAGGVVVHETLPRAIIFTPRPINTGDPCGDCARAR